MNDDLISRAAAIDILDAYQVMVENGEENPYAWARLRMSELPSAQQERIQNNALHLCDSCQYTYVTCPSHGNDAVFGDGKGNDNICACNKYRPISAQPNTYEALRILDAINSSGRLDYGDYCDLHDAISEIGGCKEDAVEPYKVGHWVEIHGYVTPGGDPVWACSECGKGIHVYGVEHGTYGSDVSDGQWVSCPNCGAVMINEKGN